MGNIFNILAHKYYLGLFTLGLLIMGLLILLSILMKPQLQCGFIFLVGCMLKKLYHSIENVVSIGFQNLFELIHNLIILN